MRRIGVLMPDDETDPIWRPRISALTQALADVGWIDGRNVRIDLRWGGGDINRIRALAQEFEIVSMMFLLLGAGSETTTHLISGSVYELLKNSSLRDWLAADSNRAGVAVEDRQDEGTLHRVLAWPPNSGPHTWGAPS